MHYSASILASQAYLSNYLPEFEYRRLLQAIQLRLVLPLCKYSPNENNMFFVSIFFEVMQNSNNISNSFSFY